MCTKKKNKQETITEFAVISKTILFIYLFWPRPNKQKHSISQQLILNLVDAY